MELIRSEKLPHEGYCPWAPEYEGVFLETKDGIVFCYSDAFSVVAVSDCGERKVLVADRAFEGIGLPKQWRTVSVPSGQWLMFNEHRGVRIQTMEYVRQVPDDVAAEYLRALKPEKYYVEAPFCFDDLTVTHHGQCGFDCHRGMEKLWSFQGRAYLYTEMIRYETCIYFGTAGHGGYFYELNLFTGEPVAAIKTGDTARMAQQGHLCYVLREDKGAKLLCVDLRDGSIVETLPLPGTAERYSALSLTGGQIHVVTFVRKRDRKDHNENKLEYAMWNAIRI